MQADTSGSSDSGEEEELQQQQREASHANGHARPSLHRAVDRGAAGLQNRPLGVALLDLSSIRIAGSADAIPHVADSSEEEECGSPLPGAINSCRKLMTAAPAMSPPSRAVGTPASGLPLQHSGVRLSEAGGGA